MVANLRAYQRFQHLDAASVISERTDFGQLLATFVGKSGSVVVDP